jgi:MazG family protein
MTTEDLLISHQPGDVAAAFTRFLSIIKKLRDPNGGCPWDLKQTFESLRPQVIEEAYEVADAVDDSDEHLSEELGDLMSVIGLYGQVGSDTNRFSFETILVSITEKLIRRHPHVFGDLKVSGTEQVLQNWEAIKQQEKKGSPDERKSLVEGLPRAMPALLKSHRLGEKCSRVGFDWPNAVAVTEKVKEELAEFLDEVPKVDNAARIKEEFGDLLFSLVQVGRHLGFNSEEALEEANNKFIRRFKELEVLAAGDGSGVELRDRGVEGLEVLWGKAKARAG